MNGRSMMEINYDYGRVADGVLVQDAPQQMDWCGNPKESTYNAHGWKLIVREPPAEPAGEGFHWEHLGWDDSQPRIRETFQKVEDEVVVRECTPFALKSAMVLAGIWDSVVAMFNSQGPTAIYDFFIVQVITESHPKFIPLFTWAKQQFGNAKAEKIIDAASRGIDYVDTLTPEYFDD